jgi:hypothetical protein
LHPAHGGRRLVGVDAPGSLRHDAFAVFEVGGEDPVKAGEVQPGSGHALIGTPARLLALRANRHAGFAGARAARRAMKSRGSSTTWVEPSRNGCL